MKNNENLSDFLKLAYTYNKVRDISEAFEEYPVEEEWHKGKVENILKEDNTAYSLYSIGDIVFVKEYRYSNGINGKNHLFVIIDQNNMAVPIENFGMLISSKLYKLKYPENKLIEKDECNGLDSIVKTDVIYKILNSQILFKVGKVDLKNIEEYKKEFYKAIKDNEI